MTSPTLCLQDGTGGLDVSVTRLCRGDKSVEQYRAGGLWLGQNAK